MVDTPQSNTLRYDDWGYSTPSIDIIEEKTDSPLGNFTGLFDMNGRPLFRPKERIGFVINGK